MEIDERGWLAGKRQRGEIEVQRQIAFEAAIVVRLLKFGGMGSRVGAFRQERKEAGDADLTLFWFNATFPRFPVILGAQKIAHVHQVTVGHLFGPNFMKLPMMKEYQSFQTTQGLDDRAQRVGLVFQWPHVPTAGTMVLHNYPIEVDRMPDPSLRAERNTRIVRPFGNPTVVYVIDPLEEFLISVGKDWAEV